MRIRDGSSDLCASDLARLRHLRIGFAQRVQDRIGIVDMVLPTGVDCARRMRIAALAVQAELAPRQHAGDALDRGSGGSRHMKWLLSPAEGNVAAALQPIISRFPPASIARPFLPCLRVANGRASCRERVCRYV